jgi:hypothetical protein
MAHISILPMQLITRRGGREVGHDKCDVSCKGHAVPPCLAGAAQLWAVTHLSSSIPHHFNGNSLAIAVFLVHDWGWWSRLWRQVAVPARQAYTGWRADTTTRRHSWFLSVLVFDDPLQKRPCCIIWSFGKMFLVWVSPERKDPSIYNYGS